MVQRVRIVAPLYFITDPDSLRFITWGSNVYPSQTLIDSIKLEKLYFMDILFPMQGVFTLSFIICAVVAEYFVAVIHIKQTNSVLQL